MALIETWFNQDLKEPVKVRYLDGNVFSADNAGNLIGVNVFNNGSPASLAGSVSASVIRADGETVAVSGALSGNKATVVLNQSCYAVPGPISIIVKITASGAITTICAVVANVYRSTTDTVIDPGTIIPSIETLIAEIEAAVASIPADYSDLWKALAPNYSTSAKYVVGQYVTYNGKYYRCNTPISSPESWTDSHWTETNIGSDLLEARSSVGRSSVADNRSRVINDYEHNMLARISSRKGAVISTSSDGVSDNSGSIVATGSGLAHATATVEKGKCYLITGTTFGGAFPSYVLLKNNAVVFTAKVRSLSNSAEKLFVDEVIEIKEDCDTIYVNGYNNYVSVNEYNNAVFSDLVTIGNMSAGAKSKTLGTVTADGFVNISASIRKGDTVIIAGVTFPNHDFPSYILVKNSAVVRYTSLSDASTDTFFDNYVLEIEDDADTIIVNCLAGHPAYIKGKNRLSYSLPLGYVMDGVISNGLGINAGDSSFKRIVAPIQKGKTYRIAGITFQNTSFPSYILLKDGIRVTTGRIGDTTSGDVYFYNNNITVTDDVDTMIVNGTSGHTHYVIEVTDTVIGQAANAVYDYVLKAGTVVEGVHQNNPSGITSEVGSHTKLIVAPGQKLRLHAYQWQNTNFVSFLFVRNGQTLVWSPATSAYRTDTWNWIEVEVPYDTNEVIVNGYSTDVPAEIYVYEPVDTRSYIDSVTTPIKELDNTNFWKGKKIVWFGTSIPAAGANPGDTVGNGSYPVRIGEMLGATVYNEAVGSSCVRFGNYAYITEGDPMGFAGQWLDNFLYSLSGSSSEKQDVFDNWNYWKNIIQSGQVSGTTLTPAQISMALSCSYDNKLYKYLTGGSVGPVDLYVFDHGHNEEYRGDYDNMTTIPPAGHESDRTYFIGAMRFIIEKILTDNPRAQICFIGHYQNDIKTGVSEAQMELADIWKYPLCKTWELIGWSQNTVTIDGVTKTLTQIWMPDNLHPSSDTTGKALKHYAEVLYPFMRDVR